MTLPSCLSVSGRFAWIIEALLGRVASRIAGVLPSGEDVAQPLAIPFVIAIHERLCRLTGRFARLVEQARHGTLPLPRLRSPSLASAPNDPAGSEPSHFPASEPSRSGASEGHRAADLPTSPARPRLGLRDLPRSFGWMVALRVPDADDLAILLRDLLQEPEMIELVSSHPAFGRVIRPLCHMLAIAPHPDLVLLPPPPPAPPRHRRRRARAARGPTLPWTRPLPHYDGLPGRDGGARGSRLKAG